MNIQTPATPVEILLVEDNPGDVRLIQEVFNEEGVPYNLHVAPDGVEAIAFLHHEAYQGFLVHYCETTTR